MRESLRKPILFLVMVVIGSLLVLLNIPLLIILPLLLVVGFATLLAVGSVTIAEIRTAIAGLGRSGILKRLNDVKFFEKSPAVPKPVPPQPAKKEPAKVTKKAAEQKPGIGSHISAFFGSIGSLGSVLKQRSRQGKKVEDIDRLLDKTVSEKVTAPPPSAALPAPAGGGAKGSGGVPDSGDPFMTLSEDEFDEGLLEGLGEDSFSAEPPAAESSDAGPLLMPDLEAGEPDLPSPEPDISSAAGDILREAGEESGGGPDAFSGLDSGDISDEDFGDLESLSVDDIDIGPGGLEPDAPAPVEVPPEPAAPAAPAADNKAVKTAWIPSDAPKDATQFEDDVSTQADMASFAGGGAGGDEDLLSSIASDVKHVKKEQDLSLLRELKDFRAPAAEIEKELGGMYERMSLAQPARKKEAASPKEKK